MAHTISLQPNNLCTYNSGVMAHTINTTVDQLPNIMARTIIITSADNLQLRGYGTYYNHYSQPPPKHYGSYHYFSLQLRGYGTYVL